MIENSSDQSARSHEMLSFSVGGQSYALEIMSVREIRGWAQPTPLPHAPAYVRGVINLRGTVLPIVDLALRLGLSEVEVTERHVIIVVHVGAQTVGLLVDAVSDILTVSGEAMQAPPDMPSGATGSFVEALTIVDERMIRILNIGALLPDVTQDAA
ncbi:MAG: chemotaxis protein CheW [Pseudomonadota bacterium]